ncbi:hypothetical protein [Humibacter sp.]|uniref:hypothetical protein n=1 Tax=Humibacter sp. TaxID=1940291 RepID=UPI003F814079
MPTQPGPCGQRVPAFAHLPELGHQLVTLGTQDILLMLESADRPSEVIESFEGVGARAPSVFQLA